MVAQWCVIYIHIYKCLKACDFSIRYTLKKYIEFKEKAFPIEVLGTGNCNKC